MRITGGIAPDAGFRGDWGLSITNRMKPCRLPCKLHAGYTGEIKLGEKQKLALALLLFVCVLFAAFLVTFAFFPSLYHVPLFDTRVTLGIPLAFLFVTTVFALMVFYVRKQ